MLQSIISHGTAPGDRWLEGTIDTQHTQWFILSCWLWLLAFPAAFLGPASSFGEESHLYGFVQSGYMQQGFYKCPKGLLLPSRYRSKDWAERHIPGEDLPSTLNNYKEILLSVIANAQQEGRSYVRRNPIIDVHKIPPPGLRLFLDPSGSYTSISWKSCEGLKGILSSRSTVWKVVWYLESPCHSGLCFMIFKAISFHSSLPSQQCYYLPFYRQGTETQSEWLAQDPTGSMWLSNKLKFGSSEMQISAQTPGLPDQGSWTEPMSVGAQSIVSSAPAQERLAHKIEERWIRQGL